ncbi:MAG TPA: 2-C-methyl-D-erythritol 2,4-cyclodiphosphate synthase [Bacteroidales bacterium]|nr:2-C-methyl-D-erythritol 2,4-cyclodiphosphate synthase [Bacteroidales bacterium]
MTIRTGLGIDFHRLEKGRDLWLGGVKIPSEKGCVAHSDGDALLHAICDALLGAAGMRDIGHYFPDSDENFRNIDSKILLSRTYSMIQEKGYSVVNADGTVCIELPRLSPFIDEMKRLISGILKVSEDDVAIKATTAEKMGFIGRGEGVMAMATVLIKQTLQ